MVGTTEGQGPTEGDEYDSAEVLDVLGDGDCRRLLGLLTAEGPKSVRDLHDRTGMAQSTLYRKMHRLSATPLVAAETHLMEGGRQPTAYRVAVESVEIELDDPVEVSVEQEQEEPEAGPTDASVPAPDRNDGPIEAPHRN